jgi:hypothetical protein
MTSAFGDQKIPMMTSISNVGKGWWPLVRKLEEELNAIDPNFELVQVKEKFGSLRYYVGMVSANHDADKENAGEKLERFHALIADAENESDHVCEVCGKTGETSAGRYGWLKTLCEEHTAERQIRDTKEEERDAASDR